MFEYRQEMISLKYIFYDYFNILFFPIKDILANMSSNYKFNSKNSKDVYRQKH